MPYASGKQERFMKGCQHNPRHMKGKCPPEKVTREFAAADEQESPKAAALRKLMDKKGR